MAKVTLTISERIAALSILNAFKGNLETMATVLEDIKQLPVSNKEWEQASKKETKIGNDVQWTWDDEKVDKKEISFQEPTITYIKNAIKEKDERKEITFQDKGLVSLNSKFK